MADLWLVGAGGRIGGELHRILGHHHMMSQHIDVRYAKRGDLGKFLPEILVYNAGVNHLNWSIDIDPDDMIETYDVNVVGLIRCIQAAGPMLGKVVVIGSDAARRPMRTSVAYNASKAALEAVVKVIARERAGELIINCVAPGLVYGTAMTEYVIERTKQLRPDFDIERYMYSQIPMGRAAEPSEVAEVVRWLVDDAPSYVQGSIIDVNGGR